MKVLIVLVVAFASTNAAKFLKEDQQVLLSTSNLHSHVQSSQVVPTIAAPIAKIESVSQSVIPGSVQTKVQSSGIISHDVVPQLYWPARILGAPIGSQVYTSVKPLTTIDKLPVVSTVNVQSAPLVYQPTLQTGYPYVYSPLGYDPGYIYQILRK